MGIYYITYLVTYIICPMLINRRINFVFLNFMFITELTLFLYNFMFIT